jgi:hypothetical protein
VKISDRRMPKQYTYPTRRYRDNNITISLLFACPYICPIIYSQCSQSTVPFRSVRSYLTLVQYRTRALYDTGRYRGAAAGCRLNRKERIGHIVFSENS